MALKDIKKEDSLKTPEPEEQQNIGFPRFLFASYIPDLVLEKQNIEKSMDAY